MDAARVFREHHRALCRYLYRFTGDADVVADAAQEAFVRLLEKPPRQGSERAWLFRVATNLVREAGRTRSRRWRILLGSGGRAPMGDPLPAPDEALEGGAARARVQRALQELSSKERMALLMREEGFAQREIAEALGTTTGSVGTLLARALDKLARHLDLDADEDR